MEEATTINSSFEQFAKWLILVLMFFAVGMPHFSVGEERDDRVSEGIASVLFGIREPFSTHGLARSGNEDLRAPLKTSKEANTESGATSTPSADLPEQTEFEQAGPYPELCLDSYRPSSLNLAARTAKMVVVSEPEEKRSHYKVTKREHPFDHIIQKAAGRYEVEASLVKAIIMAESSYNPRAISRKGARGLMQLMPRTARALGVEDSFDPELNIDAGVRYFRQLLDQFDGDVRLAVAAYNAGSRKVRKYNGIPPFKHTRYYVAKVMEYHQRYQQ